MLIFAIASHVLAFIVLPSLCIQARNSKAAKASGVLVSEVVAFLPPKASEDYLGAEISL